MKKHKPSKVTRRGHSTVTSSLSSVSKPSPCRLQEEHCCQEYYDWLPWWSPWIVTIVTAVVRAYHVSLPRNWWILHPDEIYQSIEVAFSETYGYGFRPYEYLPSPSNTSVLATTQTLESGMYALRSFLYPQMLAIVLTLARILGVDQNPFLICRIFSGIVTSTLPLAMYMMVYKLSRCRLQAFLSCALAASCLQLSVFGSHTLINSFLAPLIFLGLTLCLPESNASRVISETDNVPQKVTTTNESETTSYQNGGLAHHRSHPDVMSENKCKHKSGPKMDVEIDVKDNKLDARQTSAFEKWLRLLWNNHFMFAFRKLFLFHQAHRHTFFPSSLISPFVGGAILGVTCYLRADTSLFCIVFILPLLLASDTKWTIIIQRLFASVLGGMGTIVLCILNDRARYGSYEPTPWRWFRFNVLSQTASILFGNDNSYVSNLISDKTIVGVNICSVALLFYSFLRNTDKLCPRNQLCAIYLSYIILNMIYFIVGHQETRFLHNLFILQTIIYSFVLHAAVKLFMYQSYSKLVLPSALVAIISIHICVSYGNFPNCDDSSATSWTQNNVRQSRDVNSCLNFVRQQNDVTGLLVNASIYNYGGFAIFKHDVPILTKIHTEFHLYESSKNNILGNNSRIRIIKDYSDYIHQSNTLYIRKVLTRDGTFNYIVDRWKTMNRITDMQYLPVFVQGNYAVFKRNLTEAQERELNQASARIPLGNNATVLEYEANWLLTRGQYWKAIERAERAMEIDDARVRLFHLLMTSYAKLDLWPKAVEYQEECFKIHGRTACHTQQDKIVLHDEYRRFDVK